MGYAPTPVCRRNSASVRSACISAASSAKNWKRKVTVIKQHEVYLPVVCAGLFPAWYALCLTMIGRQVGVNGVERLTRRASSYVPVIGSLRHGQALFARSALALLVNSDQSRCGWNRAATIVTYRQKHLES
jgi:hypothetical protein